MREILFWLFVIGLILVVAWLLIRRFVPTFTVVHAHTPLIGFEYVVFGTADRLAKFALVFSKLEPAPMAPARR